MTDLTALCARVRRLDALYLAADAALHDGDLALYRRRMRAYRKLVGKPPLPTGKERPCASESSSCT